MTQPDKLDVEVITDAIYNTRTNASVHRVEARQMAESVIKALQSNKPIDNAEHLAQRANDESIRLSSKT